MDVRTVLLQRFNMYSVSLASKHDLTYTRYRWLQNIFTIEIGMEFCLLNHLVSSSDGNWSSNGHE